jgi:hypothetical protein
MLGCSNLESNNQPGSQVCLGQWLQVGAGLAAVAAAVSLVAGPWVAPPSASAVTAEQLLFLEVRVC